MEYLKLEPMRWEPRPLGPSAESAVLAEHGISHGFFGRGVEPPSERCHVRQVHGTDLVDAAECSSTSSADGIYTNATGVTIAVKTADCIPLLLVDRERRFALAIHAGWRGLTAGIVARGAALALSRGIAADCMLAAIGPCIGMEKFQVGREVIDALHAPSSGLTSAQAALCTSKDLACTWKVDLQTAAALILVNAGILPNHIGLVRACTFEHPDWHSARREGPGFGSNWAWLTL